MALRERSLRAKRKHSAVSEVDGNRKLQPHGRCSQVQVKSGRLEPELESSSSALTVGSCQQFLS